jgi:carboxylesterase
MNGDRYKTPEHFPFTIGEGPRRALLIHGFLGTPHDMRPLAQALADAGVRAHVPLLPGFGPELSQLEQVRVADWLLAAREAWRELREQAEHATLIGFSMGGAVALRLAAESGLAPDQLILLAPHWKFADRRTLALPWGKHVIRQFKPFDRVNFDNPEIRLMFAELEPEADLDDPHVRRQLRSYGAIPTEALDQVRRIGNAAVAAASGLTVPTTILQGRDDTVTLPRHSRTLARRIGADLREVPGDHLIVDPSRESWSAVLDLVVRLAAGLQRS